MLNLPKVDKRGALWPFVVKGHPEVDVKGMKREEQSLEDIMAEISSKDMSEGMEKVEQLKQGMRG